MAFKLLEMAQRRWRRLNGAHLLMACRRRTVRRIWRLGRRLPDHALTISLGRAAMELIGPVRRHPWRTAVAAVAVSLIVALVSIELYISAPFRAVRARQSVATNGVEVESVILAFLGLLGLLVLIPSYMLPTLIANSRSAKYFAGIAILNIFLGWTLLGWVGALIWAVSSPGASPAPPERQP